MKALLTVISLFIFSYSNAQNNGWAIESEYDFTLKGKAGLQLDKLLDSVFIINAKLRVIRDERFCLLMLEETSIINKSLPQNGANEEKSDSIFFDMKNKLVYNLKEMRVYNYKEKEFKIPEKANDTIRLQQQGFDIMLLKKLDKRNSPSPTLGSLPFGVAAYNGTGYSFTYITSTDKQAFLSKINDRVMKFQQGTGILPFIY